MLEKQDRILHTDMVENGFPQKDMILKVNGN